MAFWDNLGQKATETTAKAAQKAKEISDIAKFNTAISDEEAKIDKSYYQVGKLYVSMHRHDYEEEFAGMISAVNESEQKIKDFRQQIQDIKGVRRCPQCGAEVPLDVAFCSACGTPMPKVQSINSDDMIRCEYCGAMIKKEMRFCTSCGKPVSQQVGSERTDERFCPGCGSRVEGDVEFCTECGTKL